jgi:hypothetical protein
MRAVNRVKPPETSHASPPWVRMVRTSSRPPGVNVMRSAMILSTIDSSRPLSRETRSRRAGSKAISPRMARSVMPETFSFRPDEISKFVDAFLPDHGRIHVGDQKLLAPVRRGLDHDIDRGRLPSAARRTPNTACAIAGQDVGFSPAENVGSNAFCQPDRRFSPSSACAATASNALLPVPGFAGVGDQGGDVMGHGRGSRRISAGGFSAVLIAGPTASGKSALALGSLPKALESEWCQRRFHAGLRGLSVLSARPSTGGDRRTVPHHLYGFVAMRARSYSVGDYLRDVAAGAGRGIARRGKNARWLWAARGSISAR